MQTSDHEITTIINSPFPSQVPKSFKVFPTPAKISSFLTYWMQLRTLPRGHRPNAQLRWIEFLVKANFLDADGQGDPYLGALDRSETHRTLGAFDHSVHMCHYSKSTEGHAELVASTCCTAVNGVATAFIAADEPDPRLNSEGKTSFLLLQQFKGYKNNDPGEQSQQCLPFSLLKKMLERPVAHLAIFIVFHQLMLLGFFFTMRRCENVKVSGERLTHPIRKRNMVFRKGGRILPHSSPRLHLADTIAIIFEYQKSDKRNDTVTQW